MRLRKASIVAALAVAAVQLAVAGVPGVASAGSHNPNRDIVLVSQDERLVAYDVENGTTVTLVKETDWVNGPPCFVPGDSQGRFVEADDNPDELFAGTNGDAQPFYGLFDKNGQRDFDATIGDQGRIGAFAGTHPDENGDPAPGMQDPSGCTFDPVTKNLFVADVGFNHTPLQGDGQVLEFFAPSYTTWCTVDQGLSQPGMIAFDGGKLYVPESGFGQVLRYSGFATSAADCVTPNKEVWMASAAQGIGTPIGIVRAPSSQGGGWALSSVLAPSAIYHVNDDGVVVGVYAVPGPETGTPFGLAFASNGDLYFADLGVKTWPFNGAETPEDPIDAAQDAGAFRVVRAGALPVIVPIPETISTDWNFPDGVTVVKAKDVTLPE